MHWRLIRGGWRRFSIKKSAESVYCSADIVYGVGLDAVAWFDQPSFWNWFEASNDFRKLFGFHHGSGDGESDFPVWSSDCYRLQVGVLPAVLVRCTEFPRRVAVPHVLCFVCFLSTDLTNLGHIDSVNPVEAKSDDTPVGGRVGYGPRLD